MNKIEFVNSQEPAINAENLNAIQDNTEDAIDSVAEALATLGGVVDDLDTIIETGSNSNGNWIKFKNGTMITTQFYGTVVQANQWSAWGSCYASDLNVPPDYPQSFVGYPCVAKSISNSGNNAWSYYMEADLTTRSGRMGVVRPTTAGATTYFTVNVIAIGKWK